MNQFPEKLNYWLACLAALLAVPAVQAGGYTNLSVAVYFRYQEVHSIPASLNQFSNQWANIEKQVKVAKVYLETTRNAQLATEADVTTHEEILHRLRHQSLRRHGADGQ